MTLETSIPPATRKECPLEYLQLAGNLAGNQYVPVTQEAWQRFSDYVNTLDQTLEREQIDGHLVLPLREAVGATIGAAIATPEERAQMWSAGEETYSHIQYAFVNAIWHGDAAEIAETRKCLEEAISPLTTGMYAAKAATTVIYDSCMLAASMVRAKGGPFPDETPMSVVADWAYEQTLKLEQHGASPTGKPH